MTASRCSSSPIHRTGHRPSLCRKSTSCSGTFYVRARDVTALAEELEEAVPFAWGPEIMEYGMREFAIQDPNGYYLAFTEPA